MVDQEAIIFIFSLFSKWVEVMSKDFKLSDLFHLINFLKLFGTLIGWFLKVYLNKKKHSNVQKLRVNILNTLLEITIF